MYFKKPVFQQDDSLLRWLWEKKTIGINSAETGDNRASNYK